MSTITYQHFKTSGNFNIDTKSKCFNRLIATQRSKLIVTKKYSAIDSHPSQSCIEDPVDGRLHQAVVTSQKRLSQKVNELNLQNDYLQSCLTSSIEDVHSVSTLLDKISNEMMALSILNDALGAAAQFNPSREELLTRIASIQMQIKNLNDTLQWARRRLYQESIQRVRVSYTGLANDVRLMGDFDGWRLGFILNPSDDGFSDANGENRFETEIPLKPGRYRVKLLVDGKWRLAPDWPTEVDESLGETNNILVVEPYEDDACKK
mmetsp:Transcript_34887/g.62734  ORF Transcript_34887/g.62734 Transcript_34887/m.62734 type:complete len:264 (-) Transcript_34887:267-1058(-)|eukprot:CAMPEP_0175047490 /NCGR_PEP_ID=MMETSP0052_2-20121109/5626_1 /TAXON_ID=51329 ORGANISM="Polytomella parva, Strain SAG 63-3" /NCGR_SAMPLE_ID=MMETSP0052_2 /ASSEMBLY_ACC=CAM_ASM_000194 /LENGTH=263 /DNA_ID=CAMNT_0016311375 /DNA_START=72 /DNA_END=863 /DNA_ORIENTATION=-